MLSVSWGVNAHKVHVEFHSKMKYGARKEAREYAFFIGIIKKLRKKPPGYFKSRDSYSEPYRPHGRDRGTNIVFDGLMVQGRKSEILHISDIYFV